MKRFALCTFTLFLAAFSALSGTVVPREAWSVETSLRPSDHRLDMVYGETRDLECTFKNYSRPIDILGATVTLHAITNGMEEGSSFQVSGTALSNGVASVRVVVDTWLPQGLTNASYTLEVVQTNSARILRARGLVYLTSSSTASTNAPMPIFSYTNAVTKQTTLTFNGVPWQLSSNAVLSAATVAQGELADTALQSAATNGWTVSTHDGLASVASLYTLMATSQVTKVWEGTNAWWTFASNTVNRSTVLATNVWYVECPTFLEYEGGSVIQASTNFISNAPYPLEYGSYVGFSLVNEPNAELVFSAPIDALAGYGSTVGIDTNSTAQDILVGTLFSPSDDYRVNFSYRTISTTNTTVYYLQTNLVPPETWARTDMDTWQSTNQYVYAQWYTYTTNWMADGQAGQLWATDLAADAATTVLNNHLDATEPHAGKYALQTGGAMTNVTLAGAVNLTNATSFVAGSLNGTNGIRCNVSGNPTNYWLLFY